MPVDLENLVGMMDRTALNHSSHIAQIYKVEGEWRHRTYHELWQTVHHIAFGLMGRGIRTGDRVAIISRTRPEWVIADYGILSAGAVTVPIYPSLTAEQVAYIIEDAGVTTAFVENRDLAKKLPGSVVPILFDVTPQFYTLDQLIAHGATQLPPDPHPKDALHRDTLATVVYTSGTTGPPKGVMLTHGNILSNIESIIAITDHYPVMKVQEDDLALSFLPLSHILERMTHGFLIATGTTIAYAQSIDTLADDLKAMHPTILVAVPRVFEKVYARIIGQVSETSKIKQTVFHWAIAVGRKKYRLMQQRRRVGFWLRAKLLIANRLVYQTLRAALGGRLRYIVSGGAPLTEEIGEFFYAVGFAIFEGYGLTETSPVLTMNRPDRVRYGTVGIPVPNVDIRIAEDGEILAKGPNVMQSYWNRPQDTAEALIDGWFHTGDIGHINPEGSLTITDRKKNLLVLSTGKNVVPAPVEQRLILSPLIEQAVLIGDGRKYVTALLYVPGQEALTWGKNHGYEISYREIIGLPEFREYLHQEIRRLTEDFAEFERPKRFAFLLNEMTEETGELTPSLKDLALNRYLLEKSISGSGQSHQQHYHWQLGYHTIPPSIMDLTYCPIR